jgi:hypothetical protein
MYGDGSVVVADLHARRPAVQIRRTNRFLTSAAHRGRPLVGPLLFRVCIESLSIDIQIPSSGRLSRPGQRVHGSNK